MEKKKGLYEKTSYIGVGLKITFLFSLIGVVWSFWTLVLSGLILVADLLLTAYRGKLIYTFRYTFSLGEFTVTKIGLDGEEKTIKKLSAADITELSFDRPTGSDVKYYSESDDFGDDKPMKVVCGKDKFFILSDDYLYSIMRYAMRENI